MYFIMSLLKWFSQCFILLKLCYYCSNIFTKYLWRRSTVESFVHMLTLPAINHFWILGRRSKPNVNIVKKQYGFICYSNLGFIDQNSNFLCILCVCAESFLLELELQFWICCIKDKTSFAIKISANIMKKFS